MAHLTEMISVSLTKPQNDALEKCAKENERKVGAMARVAIREYLERNGFLSVSSGPPETEEE
jgi:hypothetical protein